MGKVKRVFRNRHNQLKYMLIRKELGEHGVPFEGFRHRAHRTHKRWKDLRTPKNLMVEKIKSREIRNEINLIKHGHRED